MASIGELAAGGAVEIFFVTIAAAVLYRVYGWFFATPKRQQVQAFQHGVVLWGDRVEKILGPGAYWITSQRRLVVCDARPSPFQVLRQELLTSDGMAIRISLGGEYRIIDAAAFVTQSTDAFGALFLETQQALRMAAGELSGPGFPDVTPLTTRMRELLIPKATQLGIEIMRLEVHEFVPVGWVRPA